MRSLARWTNDQTGLKKLDQDNSIHLTVSLTVCICFLYFHLITYKKNILRIKTTT